MDVGKVVTTWSYDPARVRLATTTSTLQTAGSPKIQDLLYTYDPAGSPIAIANNPPPSTGRMPGPSTTTYDYDGVDRLTHIAGTAHVDGTTSTTYDQTFGYSPSHNLLTKRRVHTVGATTPPGTNFNSTYSYGAHPHLPDVIGGVHITYDASGNPTVRDQAGSQQSLVWDDDDRMVDFTDEATDITQHNAFDADGLRVLRATDGPNGSHTTIFASPFFDIEDGTNIKHVLAGDTRIATFVDDALYFLHSNHLGSTGVVTDKLGTVHQSIEYFADGETWIDRAPSTPVNGYLFNGKPYDPETGFYDYGQPFYDPRTSLWLGVDPALIESNEIVGRSAVLSASHYASNSPIRFTDPDGRDFWDTVSAIGRGIGNVAEKSYQDAKTAVKHPIRTAQAIGQRMAFPLLAALDDAKAFGIYAGETTVAVKEAIARGDTSKVTEIVTERLVEAIAFAAPLNLLP